MSIKAFYSRVVTCNNQECAGFAIHDKKRGFIPRGFMWSSNIQCDILVVSKNPGHPLENETYRGTNGRQLFEEYMGFRKKVNTLFYNSNNPSSRFPRNKRRYLRYFLGIDAELKTYQDYHYKIEDDREIFHRTSYTNLFKCSTEEESVKIPTKILESCFNKIFVEELKIYNPKVILAAGNEVYNFLKENIDNKYPIIKVKHFSYFYPKRNEKNILYKIKQDLMKYL